MRYVLTVLTVCVCLWSCDPDYVFDEYKTVSNQWHKDSIVNFTFKAPDTITPYNVFVNLRNNNDYQYSNLFLIVSTKFPNGKIVKDTLEYRMAKPDGTFLGTGFSDIKENKLWYKEHVVFKEPGPYQFGIQQAMRKNGAVHGIENLKGILDVGLRIETTKQ